MSPIVVLPAFACVFAVSAQEAIPEKEPDGQAPGSRIVGAGVPGGQALGSEKIRAELGLSAEQEREIAALISESDRLWGEYLEKSAAARDEVAAATYAVLSGTQKSRLKEMKVVKDSWFHMVGDARTLRAACLGAEKEAEVREILAAHEKERNDAFQSVAKADPEAAERYRELQEKGRKLLEDAQKEVRSILDEAQFDALLTGVAQSQLQGIIQQGRIAKELGLTDAQREQLQAWAQRRQDSAAEIGKIEDPKERVARWGAWQEESGAEAYGLLTESQKAEVKKLPTVSSMWFYSLTSPETPGRLGLGEEQRKKVEDVMGRYREKQSEWARPSDKVVAKSREVQAEYAKMVEEAKSKIRALLSDAQFDALLTRIATFQIPYLYRREDVAKVLELTPGQTEKLEKVQKDVGGGGADGAGGAAKAWEERMKSYEKAADHLTQEQKEKLAELTAPQALVRRQNGDGQ